MWKKIFKSLDIRQWRVAILEIANEVTPSTASDYCLESIYSRQSMKGEPDRPWWTPWIEHLGRWKELEFARLSTKKKTTSQRVIWRGSLGTQHSTDQRMHLRKLPNSGCKLPWRIREQCPVLTQDSELCLFLPVREKNTWFIHIG